MPEFKTVNYAQAVSQGQQNAANAMKLREGVREVQGRNMLTQMAQQGITGREAINYATQQGRPDVAQQVQAQEQEKGKAKYEFAKRNEWGVNDQPSWEAYNNKAFAQGHITEAERTQAIQGDWKTGRTNLDRMMGRTDKKPQGAHFSGQDIFKDAEGNLFMGTGVGDPSTGGVTPSMVAIDGSGIKPQGKLNLVNRLGQTAGETIDYKAQLQSAEIRSKDDATFYSDYIPETRNIETSVDEIEDTQGLLDDLAGQTDYSSVGFGKALNKIPMTDATYWNELKSTIQARVALSKMMSLKNASATGSTGFGQLSEKELKLLTDHLGSLEQAQSPEQIKKVSAQIYKSLEATKKGYRKQLLQNRKRFRTLHKEYYGTSREVPLLDEIEPTQDQVQPPAQNAQGWSLMTDAQGNQAYVSSDGKEFEEVK